MASTSSEAPSPPIRRPYTGSCHCGLTKYIVYLTLPPPATTVPPPPQRQKIYRCNCSTCQKTSLLHVRPANSPDDFILLSPLSEAKDEDKEGGSGFKVGPGGLSDYTCFDKRIHFYFCSQCGVRCFALDGEGELATVTLEGKDVKVWKPKAEGWEENKTTYLSVNATSLDQGQEGLDLREWHEKGWISYGDGREWKGVVREAPWDWGMY